MSTSYDRSALKTGIVHLGVGAFHRAHQAVYTDAVLHQSGGDWGICGVSLRSTGVRDSLKARDNVYTVAVKSPAVTRFTTVGALLKVLVAPEDPGAVIEAIADPVVRVVTLTITEKGYCIESATGKLDLTHPDIRHDLAEPHSPRTAIGFLVAALAMRRVVAAGGLTLISCDNLTSNGRQLKRIVVQMAREQDTELADWIEQCCRFPNCMVDRIVPATTRADLDAVAAGIGLTDPAAVVTEPFSQWVIEHDFAGDVPPWDAVGAEFVEDVTPYEQMKLRLLNASHSTMAYLGSLAGYLTVADVVEDPAFLALIRQLMAAEMAPTLKGLGAFDLDTYQQALIERFSNTSLPHLTRQIAMDGSQKIPQRLLPAITERLAGGHGAQAAICGLAGWISYTTGMDHLGRPHEVEDPLNHTFARLFRDSDGDLERYLAEFLAIEKIFPPTLRHIPELRNSLLRWLNTFRREGVKQAVQVHWGSGG